MFQSVELKQYSQAFDIEDSQRVSMQHGQLRVSQDVATIKLSKDNDMETQVDFSKRSDVTPQDYHVANVPRKVNSNITSGNIVKIKVEEFRVGHKRSQLIASNKFKELVFNKDNNRDTMVVGGFNMTASSSPSSRRQQVKLLNGTQQAADKVQAIAIGKDTKFKIKPPFMQDFITNWKQLELEIEEQKYFPREEIMSPVQLEYNMKKLNFLDKQSQFKTIIDRVRGATLRAKSPSKVMNNGAPSEPTFLDSLSATSHPSQMNQKDPQIHQAFRIQSVTRTAAKVQNDFNGSVTSNQSGPNLIWHRQSLQRQNSEFGQALDIAMQKGLITKNSIQKQLRLGRTLDVQLNVARTKDNIAKRQALKTQQCNRYAKFRGQKRPSESQSRGAQESRFISSIYGREAMETTQTHDTMESLADPSLIDQANTLWSPKGSLQPSTFFTSRHASRFSKANDNMASKDISHTLSVNLQRSRQSRDLNLTNESALCENSKLGAIQESELGTARSSIMKGRRQSINYKVVRDSKKQSQNLVLRMPVVKKSSDRVHAYAWQKAVQSNNSSLNHTQASPRHHQMLKVKKIPILSPEARKDQDVNTSSIMMSPFSCNSKRRISVVQSVYIDDFRNSAGSRADNGFECVGTSLRQTVTPGIHKQTTNQYEPYNTQPLSTLRDVQMSPESHANHNPGGTKAKTRKVQKHLTSQITNINSRNNSRNGFVQSVQKSSDGKTPSPNKKGVYHIRGSKNEPHQSIKGGILRNTEDNEKSASKISQENEQLVLTPVLNEDESRLQSLTSRPQDTAVGQGKFKIGSQFETSSGGGINMFNHSKISPSSAVSFFNSNINLT